MSERNWTKEQLDAIVAENGSLLVSAAAGSGKTTVLVERVLRQMTRAQNPLPADRLLSLTFTNAAAHELRARIGRELEEYSRQSGDRAFGKKQKMLLQRAFIGTVDAFCVQLVREHFGPLGLPPDIAVGDAALLSQLSEAALAETMEEMYADENFARFSAMFGRARSDRQAEETILDLYTYTRTLPHPDTHLDAYAAMYEGSTPLAETVWGGELLRFAASALESALLLCREALDIAAGCEALAGYLPAVQGDKAVLEETLASVQRADWDAARACVKGYRPLPLKAVRNAPERDKERVKTLRGRCKEILGKDLAENCFACTEAEFERDRADALPLVRALVRATRLYAQKYDEAKLAQKVLDFADFEHYALRLLQDDAGRKTPRAEKISGMYDVVMVDEYQDTNELQNTLYNCFSRPDNLFLVGDVKQSIYRFRRANPGLFLDVKGRWQPYEAGCEGPAVVMLGHNFRSGKGVVEGVNHVFRQLMSEELGEIRYGAGEALIQGSPGGDEEGFELCLVDDPGALGDAGVIARRIQSMVQDGYELRGKKGTRRCDYGDFAILLRTKAKTADYMSALSALGIPAVSDGGERLLDSPEILPLSAVLTAIDNPGDEVALAAAMLGPLFHFTPDEVTALRAQSDAAGLWGMLAGSGEPKVRHFVERLNHYRVLAAGLPVVRLCEELVEQTGYLSAVSAMENGEARRDNVFRFIGWAGEVSASGRGSLSAFVRLLREGKGPESGGFKAVERHVSVLTIHKSKGLEFPVCFLADTTRRFNLLELAGRVQVHAALGVGMFLRKGGILYPTLPLLAIRSRAGREAQSEEMRVLYVALTRAMDKLIVTSRYDGVEEQLAKKLQADPGVTTPYLLSRQRCYADWLLTAALAHPECGPIYKAAGLERAEWGRVCGEGEAGRLTLRVEQAVAAEAGGGERFQLTAAPDEALSRTLAAAFARQPEGLALSQLPAKVSVSALTKPQGAELLKRPSFMYREGLTAAEKGTLQHSVLQYADIEGLRRNVDKEVERLVAEGLLSAETAGYLDRKGLGVFAASPLAARMQSADRLYREYDFLTGVPASRLQPDLPPTLADRQVLVQGIADAILQKDGKLEIVDYKTDRGKTEAALRETYRGQLTLYRDAVQKRLQLPVERLTIWSFALGREVAVEIP